MPALKAWASAALGTALVLALAGWKGGGGRQPADALLLGAVAAGGFGYVQGARLSVGGPGGPCRRPKWISGAGVGLAGDGLPVAMFTWPTAPVRIEAWGAFAYVAVFSMWLGSLPGTVASALGGTLGVSQVQLAQPFLSMALAVPLLGESLTP
ncbi:MAG: hypothetical protein IPP87_16750 [Ideonella sp.]|nr:hypothetical protein [Ideonella sp.]